MQLSFKVHKTPDFIFNYLTNMQLFVSVHPVISRIDHVRDNEYKVFETLMLGPIPYSFTYIAIIDSDLSLNSVTINAIVMKVTKIEMKFRVKQHDGYCIVHENIDFKSPLPVKGIMSRVFKAQHKKLFENIDQI